MERPHYQRVYKDLIRICEDKGSVRASLSRSWRDMNKGSTGNIERYSKTMLAFAPDDKGLGKQWIVSMHDIQSMHVPEVNLMGEQ